MQRAFEERARRRIKNDFESQSRVRLQLSSEVNIKKINTIDAYRLKCRDSLLSPRLPGEQNNDVSSELLLRRGLASSAHLIESIGAFTEIVVYILERRGVFILNLVYISTYTWDFEISWSVSRPSHRSSGVNVS